MKEVYEFLKNCGTFYLATEENGKPHVRPFGAVSSGKYICRSIRNFWIKDKPMVFD